MVRPGDETLPWTHSSGAVTLAEVKPTFLWSLLLWVFFVCFFFCSCLPLLKALLCTVVICWAFVWGSAGAGWGWGATGCVGVYWGVLISTDNRSGLSAFLTKKEPKCHWQSARSHCFLCCCDWSCVPKERGTISWLQQSCIYIHSSEIHLWKEWRISYCCPVLQLAGAWSLGCFLKGHSLSQLLHAQKSQPKPPLDSCIMCICLKSRSCLPSSG